jgi:hypothetical protein
MSSEMNKTAIPEKNHLQYKNAEIDTKKVNLNDLLRKLNEEEKNTKKQNVILSVAAVSVVTALGFILTI